MIPYEPVLAMIKSQGIFFPGELSCVCVCVCVCVLCPRLIPGNLEPNWKQTK